MIQTEGTFVAERFQEILSKHLNKYIQHNSSAVAKSKAQGIKWDHDPMERLLIDHVFTADKLIGCITSRLGCFMQMQSASVRTIRSTILKTPADIAHNH